MGTSAPIAEAVCSCGGQDSHRGAETRSHAAEGAPNNLNNAEFGSVQLLKLSICCARSRVCLIQQEPSPQQDILMRFSHHNSS